MHSYICKLIRFSTYNKIRSVQLTLCQTQVHAGEDQKKEKSLKLHGCCCSCCADRCKDTNRLNHREKQKIGSRASLPPSTL